MRDSGLISCHKIISVAPSLSVLLGMGISRQIEQSFTLTCWIYAEERRNLLIKAKPRSTRQTVRGRRVCALAYFSADIERFLENTLPERHCLHKHCSSTQSTERNIPETTSANCCTNAWNEATVWHEYVLLTVVLSTGTCLYILIGSGWTHLSTNQIKPINLK